MDTIGWSWEHLGHLASSRPPQQGTTLALCWHGGSGSDTCPRSGKPQRVHGCSPCALPGSLTSSKGWECPEGIVMVASLWGTL